MIKSIFKYVVISSVLFSSLVHTQTEVSPETPEFPPFGADVIDLPPFFFFPQSVYFDNSNQVDPYANPVRIFPDWFFVEFPDIKPNDPIYRQYAPEFMEDFFDMPDFYPEMTAPGFGDSIDPMSRTLRIIHTDAVLKTNGGLDIPITRFYRHIHSSYFFNSARSKHNNLNSALGLGWQMHFGRFMWSKEVKNPCDSLYHFTFESPTGDIQQFFAHKGNKGWVSKNFWRGWCEERKGDYVFVARSPSGMTYQAIYNVQYNNVRQSYVHRVADTHYNYIDIDWAQKNGVPYINKITSSDKSVITFENDTTGDKPKLTSIKIDGLDKIKYGISEQQTNSKHSMLEWLGQTYHQLDSVTLPTGKSWNFAYFDGDKYDGTYLLNQQTHPNGATVDYVFSTGYQYTQAVKQTVTEVDGKKAIRRFKDYRIRRGDNASQRELFATSVEHPDGTTKAYYYYAKKRVDANTKKLVRVPRWQVGLLRKVELLSRTDKVRALTEYTYGTAMLSDRGYWSSLDVKENKDEVKDEAVFAPVVIKKHIWHDKDNFVYSYKYQHHPTKPNEWAMEPTTVKFEGENGTKIKKYEYSADIYNYGVRVRKESVMKNDSETDVLGEVVYDHNAKGKVTSKNAYGVKTTYTYHNDGSLKSVTDANNHVTKFDDYLHGIPQTETLADDTVIKRTVQSPGRLTSSTNGRGKTTRYGYDGGGRVVSITPPIQQKTLIDYGIRKQTAGRGRMCVIDELDGQGRITKRTARAFKTKNVVSGLKLDCTSSADAEDTVIEYGYDKMGRQNYVSLPNKDYGTRTTYESLGRVWSVCLLNNCTRYDYDDVQGNVTIVEDGEGRKEYLKYRGLGSDRTLIQSRKELSRNNDITVDIQKDNLNRPTSVTSHGLVSTYTYEKKKIVNGQEKMVNYPFLVSYADTQTGTETYTYDSVGNVKTKTHNGKTTNYDYDALDRLREIRYADAGTVSYTYDNNSNVKTAKRAVLDVSWTKSYKYNAVDQLTTLTHSKVIPGQRYAPYQIVYGYDDIDGALTSLTYPSGNKIEYAPDAYGRPTKVGDYATNVQYHGNGAIKSYQLGNGKAVSYGLDGLDRVDNILVPNVLSRSYGYDDSHNIITRRDDLTQTASMITYDDANRLISETSGSNSIGIDYRPDQNIHSITKNGVARTIGMDAQHRPTSGFDGEVFSYDGYGNINAMTGGKTPQTFAFFSDGTLVSAGTQHNAYRANFATPRNAKTSKPYNYIALTGEFPKPPLQPQNIGAQRLSSNHMFYFYDADNQRTVRANQQNKREFMIYGSEGLLAEYDDAQQPQVEYIRLGGKVIAQRGKATANGCTKWLFCESFEDNSGISGGATSGNVTYLHNDILGTPVAATDKSGNLKWRSYRMAFGMVENPQSEPSRTKFPIGYTGHEFDAETGLTYAQARYYRRDSGAFISPDPITFRENDLVSINRYAYGANNPYKYTDPTGMAGFSNCAMYGGCSATPEEMRQNLYNAVDFFIPIDLARECYNGGSGCTTAAVLIEGAGFFIKPAKLLRRVERLCFVEGTLVETPDGKVAIEDIKVGDWVLSKDDLTGKVAFKQVTTLFLNADKLIYELSVVNEQGETEVIGTTAEHPFYVKDKGWTKTIQLLVGDKITTADDNIVTVFAVKLSPTRQDTYNFEVDDYHTYFVGKNKLWVHNECFDKQYVWDNVGKLTDKSQRKAVSSLLKRREEHIKKLDDYMKDPVAQDHLGKLKNARTQEEWNSIYDSRVKHLKDEIKGFEKMIMDIMKTLFE